MKYFKLLAFVLGLAVGFIFCHPEVKAEDEFVTDSSVEYRFSDNGRVVVSQDISIENLFTNLYVTSYSLILDNIEAENIRAIENGQALNLDIKKDQNKTQVEIRFNDALVGKGKKRNFQFIYENKEFSQKTGEVWEISIPRLDSRSPFRNYNVSLLVPASFGNEAYLSPNPESRSVDGGYFRYFFGKNDLLKTGITAGYGSFQVFSFTLNYHLENPLNKDAYVEIAIPPDTALQKMYYQKINPLPKNTYTDEDGNWLAQYRLTSRQRLDIEVIGSVQIFAGTRPFLKPTSQLLTNNLKESKYWEVSNPKIKDLALQLKTPQAIYDYVASTLRYDYDRVKPNVVRLGALYALENPNSAICMEFSDLFIALSRSAGIPAREVNGFAYTENPKIQPLSLVADVLHSWPEYWNENLKAWVPVDPTWASTTGGVDYFNKLDLRHFTFVIHGQDALKPYAPGSYKLGVNPQKDIFVNFGQLPNIRTSDPKIEIYAKNEHVLFPLKYTVKITNPGPVALYNVTPTITLEDSSSQNKTVDVLLPFANYETEVTIPFSILGKKTPASINVALGGSSVTVATAKIQVILVSLIIVLVVIIILVVVMILKLKKNNFFSTVIGYLAVLKSKLHEIIYPKH